MKTARNLSSWLIESLWLSIITSRKGKTIFNKYRKLADHYYVPTGLPTLMAVISRIA